MNAAGLKKGRKGVANYVPTEKKFEIEHTKKEVKKRFSANSDNGVWIQKKRSAGSLTFAANSSLDANSSVQYIFLCLIFLQKYLFY